MAIKKAETVDIIGAFVGAMSSTGQLESTSNVWIDNLDGTYTLPLCRTYWFKVGDTIIDPVTTDILPIVDVQTNQSITVTASVLPSGNSVKLPEVKYFHGTVINTNNELSNIPHSNDKTPMVYLLEQFEERHFEGDSVLDREVTLRLFFLEEANSADWSTDEHYTNAIWYANEMINYFLNELLFKAKGIGRINDYFITNRVNFGVYQTDRGAIQQVFNDQLTGKELRITIPISKNFVDCYCEGIEPNILRCAPVGIYKNNTFQEYVRSGGSYYYTDTCADATYIVKYADETPIQSGIIVSGGSVTVTVPNCPTPEPCADATATLRNTNDDVISVTTIESGANETIIAPDGQVDINGVTFDTVPSDATLNISVRQSTGNTEVGEKQGQYFRIDDSTVNVNKSDSTLISAVTVKAEATESYNVADSVVNVNAVKLADVKATDTLNITVVDSLDASVSVTLSGGNKIIVDDLPCSGGTCNDAYQIGADFLTLDRNNPFGNTNRFTAPDGTQTYTDGIAIDWLFARDYAETVIGYGVSIIGPANHATQIGNEPYTIGAFSGFTLIHHINLFRIVQDDGTKAPANGLDYSPFNYVITGANNTRVRSGDNFYNDTASTWLYNNNGNLSIIAKTTSVSTMIERQFTYAELGI